MYDLREKTIEAQMADSLDSSFCWLRTAKIYRRHFCVCERLWYKEYDEQEEKYRKVRVKVVHGCVKMRTTCVNGKGIEAKASTMKK